MSRLKNRLRKLQALTPREEHPLDEPLSPRVLEAVRIAQARGLVLTPELEADLERLEAIEAAKVKPPS